MECAGRNPKRSIEEVASSSSEPTVYRRKAEEEEKENHRKRKAEEGSIKEDEMEGRVKSRMNEDEKDRRKKEEDRKGSFTKEGGETRGDIDKTMNVDMMEEEEFQERKTDLRENRVPLVILRGANWKRIAQLGEIQNTGGEFYIWEMPRNKNTAIINSRMRNIGGPGIIVKDTKIWTNSNRVKERVDEELRKRKTVLHSERIRWADDKDAKMEGYKLGRAVGEAIREELADTESEDICLMEEDNAKPGILHIEDGNDKHVYYCDSWGQYWDEDLTKHW